LSLLVFSFRERLERIFEGENIPPKRSLRSPLPLKNRHSSFVEVAPVRLLRGMSLGEMEIPILQEKLAYSEKTE